MKNYLWNVEIYTKQDRNDMELYKRTSSFEIISYKRRDGRKEEVRVPVEPGRNVNIKNFEWDVSCFMEENRAELEQAVREELFKAMMAFKERKWLAGNKKIVKHFQIKNCREVIFDTMTDAPNYWRLPETTIRAIVNGIDLHKVMSNGNNHDYLVNLNGEMYRAFIENDGRVKYYKQFAQWHVVETKTEDNEIA